MTYVPMTRDEYAAELTTHGIPVDVSSHIADVIADALDGRNAVVTDDVERVLGRPARDFATYAREAAATGVWDLAVPAAG